MQDCSLGLGERVGSLQDGRQDDISLSGGAVLVPGDGVRQPVYFALNVTTGIFVGNVVDSVNNLNGEVHFPGESLDLTCYLCRACSVGDFGGHFSQTNVFAVVFWIVEVLYYLCGVVE